MNKKIRYTFIILYFLLSSVGLSEGSGCLGTSTKLDQAEFDAGYVKAFGLKSLDDIEGLKKIPKWRLQMNLKGMHLIKMIVASYPKVVVNVFYTYIKILKNKRIFLKLMNSLVGRDSWSKGDSVKLKNTILDIPKMIVTRGARWVIPGGAVVYASLAASKYGNIIFPDAYFSAKPPEAVTRFLDRREEWFVAAIQELKGLIETRDLEAKLASPDEADSKEAFDVVTDMVIVKPDES